MLDFIAVLGWFLVFGLAVFAVAGLIAVAVFVFARGFMILRSVVVCACVLFLVGLRYWFTWFVCLSLTFWLHLLMYVGLICFWFRCLWL